MTDQSQSAREMVELADEYERGLVKMETAGYEEFACVIPRHKLIIAALRLAAQAAPGEPVAWREAETVRLINLLRADEGDSVTILCDNPDFNGQPNCAVVCNGDWTGWVDKRFAADTVLDVLTMAVTEKNLPSPRKVIATSNGHHWIQRFHLVCCRDCGFVRRADDQNAPCKGPVGVGIRHDLATPVPAASPQAGRDPATIEALAADFENSVHHVWDKDEVASRIRSLASGGKVK